jgi:hypothetical protein
MPSGIYKKIEPDRVLTEVAPTGINDAKQVNRQGLQQLVAQSAGCEWQALSIFDARRQKKLEPKRF